MTSPTPLLVATRNRHKTEEIRAKIGHLHPVTDANDHPDLPTVEETGTTFLENATLKALTISRLVPGLVLSDDSGLEVDALNGAPGVWSSSFGGVEGDHARNNDRLLRDLTGVIHRSARFRCTMVLASNGSILASFSATVEGSILSEPQGSQGFGYDPLFVPDGFSDSFAELGMETKNQLSHRARCLDLVIDWLSNRKQL